MNCKSLLIMITVITVWNLTPLSILSQTVVSDFALPQSLGVPVNSGNTETGPVVAPNGLSLYFSGDGPGTIGGHDLWVSQRPTLTAAWGTPQNLGSVINTDGIENMPALSPDGKTMFFNGSDRPDGFGAADIYVTTRTDPNNDFGWTSPVNLGSVINTVDGEVGPGYFENPTNRTGVLYFTSNRPDGLGGEDIYQSIRNANGTFNAPTNVTELNSISLDRNAGVRRDGLEMLFTSDREGGSGNRDIWVSTRGSLSAPWNPPVNLAAVNSDGIDQMPSFSPDGSVFYLSSNRDGSQDIYAATRVSSNRIPTADFDGDGRTDVSVFRPSDGTWYVMESGSSTFRATQFGASGDKVVAGDYDGDGRTDIAIFRPSDRNWYIQQSSSGSVSIKNWGIATDRLVPGDYDGDGRTDIAVYRNGTWYIVQSSGGFSYQQFGLGSDIPVAGVNQ